MRRKRRDVVSQATEVDDATHAGARGGPAEVRRGAAIPFRELLPGAHRVHQVVGGLHAVERALERGLVETVALHDLRRAPRGGHLTGPAREAPHRLPSFFERSKKAATDVAGRTGEEDIHSEPLGQHHRIDHVDDAVAGRDVGLGDVGSSTHGAALRLHRDGVAADRLGVCTFTTSAAISLRDDVIREDPPQLLLVLRL